MDTLLHIIPYLLSFIISGGVGVYSWRRREIIGALPFSLVALSQAFWTFGYIFELLSPGLSTKEFWDDLQNLGAAGWPLSFLYFSLQYTGRKMWRPRFMWPLMIAWVTSYLILVYTNDYHHLVKVNPRLIAGQPFSELTYGFSTLSKIFFLPFFATLATGIVLLFHELLNPHRLYRIQVAFMIIGTLIPLAGALLTLFDITSAFVPHRDVAPFTFGFSNLLIAWALFRYRMFDVVPIGRDTVIDNMDDVVIVLDGQNRVVDLNPAARRALVQPSSSPIGRPAALVFSAWPDFAGMLQRTEEAHGRMITVGGNAAQYYQMSVLPLRDQKGVLRGRLIVARDISEQKRAEEALRVARDELERKVEERTRELVSAGESLINEIRERKKLEEQFFQAQKMEAVGRLAGGVAHDFNNLLSVILGYTELLTTSIAPKDHSIRDPLLEIEKAGERAKALTRQLLAFSRRQLISLRTININELITGMEQMLKRLIGEDVRVLTNLDKTLGPIMADPFQIEQILLNLAINARDAMPGGGELTIETTSVRLDETDAGRHREVKPGDYVLLSVSDTGQGMDAELQKHIFEPFFTTKETGKGTGLGLSTAYGVVKQHEGHIWVDSEPGKGTTFRIYLPQTSEVPIEEEVKEKVIPSPPATATILLAEDDAALRQLTFKLLTQLGHKVYEARDARDALAIAAEKRDALNLLLTDVVMPETNGRELYERVRAFCPNIKVVYMSGYAENVIAHHGVLERGVLFVQKPFSMQALREILSEALSPA